MAPSEIYPLHFTDNANSWQRLWLLCRLYWPGIRPGIIICGVTPVLLTLLFCVVSLPFGHPVAPILDWPLTLLFFLSPVMLARRDYRGLSAQLPVTAAEKLGFLLLLFWGVMPALLMAGCAVGDLLARAFMGSRVEGLLETFGLDKLADLSLLGIRTAGGAMIVSWLYFVEIVTIVLYYVVTTRKNRVLAAFVSYFATICAYGLVSGICGAVVGMVKGYGGVAANMPDAEVTAIIQSSTSQVLIFANAVLFIAAILYLIKLYNRLRNSGF